MTLATAVLVAASLLLSVLAGPIYHYTSGGAVELRAQAPYILAVLPDAQRGTGWSHTETEEENPATSPTPVPPPLGTPSPLLPSPGHSSPSPSSTSPTPTGAAP